MFIPALRACEMAMGAGVIIARYFGARQQKELQKAIHTTVAFGILCGILLTISGVVLAPKILVLMKTPADILPKSTLYFQVYAMGSLGLVLYNNFVGIMQAVGDSRHPLYYLIFSSLLNVTLDMVFVGAMGMGVEGAALATIIAQFASALLCLYRLMKKSPEEYTVSLRKINLDPYMVKQIVSNGLPAGVQNSVIAIANVVVQSNINSFGKLAVAGCGAYSKVEGFAFLPVTCFTMAITTFVGQNLGAKQPDRIRKGLKQGMAVAVGYGLLAGLVLIFAGRPLSMIFVSKSSADVLDASAKYLRCMGYFYWSLGILNTTRMVTQGLGYSTRAVFSGVTEMLARTIVSLGFVGTFGFTAICFADQTAWITACLYIAPTCVFCIKKATKSIMAGAYE